MSTKHNDLLQQLAGAWQLVSSEFRTSTGQVIYPLGEDAQGRVILTASGYMSGQLMARGRPGFASADQSAGTEAEIRTALEGYVAYYGSYELNLEEKKFITHVEGSLFPNWVGEDQIRFFELEGDRLVLKTPPFKRGDQEFVGALEWRRL